MATIGAYAIERDYSHYVAYAAKTVFAVVGTASKGPVGVATVCTSAQDLVNKFGPLTVNYYGLYAGQYFLSQSSKLYYVRAASDSITEAKVKVPGTNSSDATVSGAITFAHTELGTYGDGYKIKIGKGTSDNTYKITVYNPKGAIVETIKDVTLDTLIEKDGDSYIYKTPYIKVVAHDSSVAKLTTSDTTEYILAGGSDGIDDIEAADYIDAANALAADTIDMNLFAVPGVSDASVIIAMLSLAESRGDCLYLVDPPRGLTRDGVVNWHNGLEGYDEHAAFNSSYGALYYDWVTIYDSVNKVKLDVPPSVPVAASIAYSDRVSELWFAPAGLQRGIIRGVLEPVTKLSKSDVDYLYSEDNNINSLYEDPQVGMVIWGQKTLARSDTALNRINVRRLLNYLKRIVTAACNYLTFEPNDRITWNSFEMKVTPVLESIKKRRGIYEYSVIKGETIITPDDIDNYRMPCMILIRPTKAAEEIPIYFTITSTGADFNDVLEANSVMDI